MIIHLGLGSNLGDRRANLRAAIDRLARYDTSVERISPVVESPALLLENSRPEWNRPFLNLVLRAATQLSPADLLAAVKKIEAELGRESGGERWAPRAIDIDILLYGDQQIELPELRIPHAELSKRAFVMTPLLALDPSLPLPGHSGATVFDVAAAAELRIPLWMGIVNLTPDSFSDGGRWQTWADAEANIAEMADAGAHFIDLGAESTRPGARVIDAEQEWTRLAPVLERVIDRFRDDPLRPRISVDTYHADVAHRALGAGVDVINDVGGLTDDAMMELAAASHAEFVAMHQLSIPADPATTLPQAIDPVDALHSWLDRQLERWRTRGIDTHRVYFDPGIGFGKNSLQSLTILRRCEEFRRHGLRILVGHSRKSFMHSFSAADNATRDLTTVGASLHLAAQGVDVIRVHNVTAHTAAVRGWQHLQY